MIGIRYLFFLFFAVICVFLLNKNTAFGISILEIKDGEENTLSSKELYLNFINDCKEMYNCYSKRTEEEEIPIECQDKISFYKNFKNIQNLPMIAGAVLIDAHWIIGSAHNLNGAEKLGFICSVKDHVYFSGIKKVYNYPNGDLALAKLSDPISSDCAPVKIVDKGEMLHKNDCFYAVSDYLHHKSGGISDSDVNIQIPMDCFLQEDVLNDSTQLQFFVKDYDTIKFSTHGGDSGSGIVRKRDDQYELVAIYPAPKGKGLGAINLGNGEVAGWIKKTLEENHHL